MIVFAKEIERRKESSRQGRSERRRGSGRNNTVTSNKRYYANAEYNTYFSSEEKYPALATYERPGLAERVVGFFERLLGDTSFPAYTEPAFVLNPMPAGDSTSMTSRGWGGARRASEWRMLTKPLSKMPPRQEYPVDPRLSDMRVQPPGGSTTNHGEHVVREVYPSTQIAWKTQKAPPVPERLERTNIRGGTVRKAAIGQNYGPGATFNGTQVRDRVVERPYESSANPPKKAAKYGSSAGVIRQQTDTNRVSKWNHEGVDQGRDAREAGLGGSEHLYPERKYNVGS